MCSWHQISMRIYFGENYEFSIVDMRYFQLSMSFQCFVHDHILCLYTFYTSFLETGLYLLVLRLKILRIIWMIMFILLGFPRFWNSLAGSQSSGLHVALDGLPPPGFHALCHHALHTVSAIRSPSIIPLPSCCPLLTPWHCPTKRQRQGLEVPQQTEGREERK